MVQVLSQTTQVNLSTSGLSVQNGLSGHLTPKLSHLHIPFSGISNTNAENLCYVKYYSQWSWERIVEMSTRLPCIVVVKIWSPSDHIC